MALEKLQISIEDQPQKSSFSVLFNPSQITLGKSVSWSSNAIGGRNAAEAKFEHGSPFTLSLDLFFDTYETGEDVRHYTRDVENLAMIQKGQKQPAFCRLSWGKYNFGGYRWVLVSLNQRFSLFLPDGTPVRATLGCSFQQSQSELDELLEASIRQLDGDMIHLVRSVDSLSRIAAEKYKNAALWRVIAMANRIDNPRRLLPGTALLIPALGSVIGFRR